MSYNLRPASLTPSVWPLLRREMRSVSDKQPCKENDDNLSLTASDHCTESLSQSSQIKDDKMNLNKLILVQLAVMIGVQYSECRLCSLLGHVLDRRIILTDWLAGTLPYWPPAPHTYKWSPPPSRLCPRSLTRKIFFNSIFRIIFMRRCWVWILSFFSSSEVFYYVYREVSETQCACWPEESVSYILKAHRNFSSEQDSSSGWVANMNS